MRPAACDPDDPSGWTLDGLVAAGAVAPDWGVALAPVAADVVAVGQRLAALDAAGEPYQPRGATIWRAFARPMSEVRVLVVGQDPYPTLGMAVGLSFSVPPEQPTLPPSLRNILAELAADVRAEPPGHGDLSAWADQGVLLLNRVLTVRPGARDSHRGLGWEPVTEAAVRALADRGGCVSVLWGLPAQTLRAAAPHPQICSSHPSPLSAHRSGSAGVAFLGSRPFSAVNAALGDGQRIDWQLPAADR